MQSLQIEDLVMVSEKFKCSVENIFIAKGNIYVDVLPAWENAIKFKRCVPISELQPLS